MLAPKEMVVVEMVVVDPMLVKRGISNVPTRVKAPKELYYQLIV